MKQRMSVFLLCMMILLTGIASADSFYEDWRNTEKTPILREVMAEWTEAGAMLTPEMAEDQGLLELIRNQFNT